MALYPGLTLTDAGIQMIAESQLNETKLIITKAKIGDGDLPMGQDISKMTDVLSPKLEAPFSSFKNLGDGQIDIKFAVSNAEVKAGFFAKEIGIFATLEDGSETLYAYTNAGNKTDWVPDKSTPIDSQIIECQLKIGNAPNVIINISDKTYALAEDLANHESSDESHKDLFDSIKIALNTKANKLVNGHGIVRSVNNQYADDSGNVNVSGIDIGMIIPFAGNGDIPVGFLLCDGASVLRDTYPDLFSVIGTTYGAVDDTHFNLPDLIDRFAEGSETAGGYKEAGLPNIKGSVTGIRVSSKYGSSTAGPFTVKGSTDPVKYVGGATSGGAMEVTFNASRSNKIYGKSNTVQPPSLTVRYIIKAFKGASASSTGIKVRQLANELNELNGLNGFKSANDYIVESYSDENGNWYRKYKSGWVEQGGVITVSKTSYNIPVNFLKPYANSNYALACNYTSPSSYASSTATTNSDTATRIACATNRHSTTGFYLSQSIVNIETKWYACGQGVEE